jgi:hypothetical protein
MVSDPEPPRTAPGEQEEGAAGQRGEVTPYLSSVVFPASRDQLLMAARSKDAPQPVLDVLESLPVATYRSIEDVRGFHDSM